MNPVSWFEIPAIDLSRAVEFYQQVFELELELEVIDGHPMALFPGAEGASGCSGAIATGDSYVPSINGTRVYFNVDRAQEVLDRAQSFGATILYPLTQVNDRVLVAEFTDSEGNRLAISQHIKEASK